VANDVTLNVRLNRPQYAATGQPQIAYALVDAMPASGIAAPRPLNFCFVLDHSGSMAGEKLRNLKEAVKLALDLCGPNDFVSVIEFDDTVHVIAPSQQASPANLNGIKQKVDRMKDAGGTQISIGMRVGLEELRKHQSPDRVSRMLLLTDGQTSNDEAACLNCAQQAAASGVAIAAYGLGDDWNQQLLDEIAQHSGGTSGFVQHPSDIGREFSDALRAAQGEVVQNAELLLRLVKGVMPRNAWRLTPQIQKLSHRVLSDRDVTVPMGSLDAQQGGSVLIELMLPARPAGEYRLAQADLRYDVPAMQLADQHAVRDVMLTFTNDPRAAEMQDPAVAGMVQKVSAFNLQTRALDDLKTGNLAAATQKLHAAATQLLDIGETDLAAVAQQEADNLARQGKMTDLGTKKLSFGTRKLTQKLNDTP
jgi:Ca-activated chloride channel family protein